MYEIRPVEATDDELLKSEELFRAAFPHAHYLNRGYLSWQYRDNPDGKVIGFNAWAAGELAAHYVTIPTRARIDGKVEPGVLSLNTATHPQHQGKGLFTKLAEATYAAAAERGNRFVIGVGNANSTHGLVKKLAFQFVAPLEARLGVGRIRRTAKGAPSFEKVWSDEALRWRLSNPVRRYTARPSGERRAVEAPTGRAGIHAIITEVESGRLPSLPPTHALNPVRLWIGADPAVDWARSRFYSLPDRLRLSPLNLVYRDLKDSGYRLTPGDLKFEAIDFDPY